MEKLVVQLAEALLARHWQLVSAESCTGGWIAKLATDLAGSSAWFERGIVCYSNAAKSDLLGVDPQLIAEHGAVSEAVVKAMAAGALATTPADIAVAVSGIAGPTGGSAAKPVGTVWIGWASRQQQRQALYQFVGDRDGIRRQAVTESLRGLLTLLADSAV